MVFIADRASLESRVTEHSSVRDVVTPCSLHESNQVCYQSKMYYVSTGSHRRKSTPVLRVGLILFLLSNIFDFG